MGGQIYLFISHCPNSTWNWLIDIEIIILLVRLKIIISTIAVLIIILLLFLILNSDCLKWSLGIKHVHGSTLVRNLREDAPTIILEIVLVPYDFGGPKFNP